MRPKLLRIRLRPVKDLAMKHPRLCTSVPRRQFRGEFAVNIIKQMDAPFVRQTPSAGVRGPTAQRRPRRPAGQLPRGGGRGGVPPPPPGAPATNGFLCPSSPPRLFKLFLELRRVILADAFLDRLRRRLDEILRFLEAEPGDRPDL